ncbi:hypothetical protein F9288_00485 [Sphingomonas sp. CL5.1]|uniref:asparagine synthase-related protein n=1 Tax=Sphingomonas sp. CL5.1 TaxID=2653203 RepID=UPI001583EF08|nr:asparagine synthetase B family protein [Sphingomonas sp. CL5.1]QKR98298.1 hypothetical protein F9288_00485 [Sphingomonas sp. CL5.1]
MKLNSFLALVPRNPDSAVAARQALLPPGMSERLGSDTILLFVPDDTPWLLFDGDGVIVGDLFDPSSTRISAGDPDSFRQWRATGGKALLDRHWGSYLALLPGDDGVTVLRDPSGGVACYYAATAWGLMLASDAALLTATGLIAPTIDWDEILAQLIFVSLRTPRTALDPIRELLPGSTLHTDGIDVRVDSLWSPYRYVEGWTANARIDDAADGLRRIVTNTVGAWARVYPKSLSELSGGLDSSIITACLARAGGEVAGVTVRGRQADLDETPYAQLVADTCNIPLHRLTLDTAFIDLGRSASARLPRPTARIFGQASDLQIAALGRTHATQAFFSGGTGDTVMWYFNTVTPALDRLAVDGVAGFLGTIGDLAEMCAVPRSRALALAARKLLHRRPQPWPHDCLFLAPDVCRELPAIPPHPWWAAPRGTRRGVRAYVRALIQMQDHFEYYDRSEVAPLITPFYAQPVIEFCLSVPSWLWCAGGRNRAVARHAFADMLPRAILERRTKGGFDGFANEVLLERRGEAHTRLREGHLARAGLLDLPAIDAALLGERPIAERSANRLLRLLAIEAWLGCWASG